MNDDKEWITLVASDHRERQVASSSVGLAEELSANSSVDIDIVEDMKPQSEVMQMHPDDLYTEIGHEHR